VPRYVTVLYYLNTPNLSSSSSLQKDNDEHEIDRVMMTKNDTFDEKKKKGHTWFPLALTGDSMQSSDSNSNDEDKEKMEGNNETALFMTIGQMKDPKKDGITVPPRQGDALIFYNFRTDGKLDPLAAHAGLPCGNDDNKWIANQWFRLPIRNNANTAPSTSPLHHPCNDDNEDQAFSKFRWGIVEEL